MFMFPPVLNVKAPISRMMLFGGKVLGCIIIRPRLGHEGGDFTSESIRDPCTYKSSSTVLNLKASHFDFTFVLHNMDMTESLCKYNN